MSDFDCPYCGAPFDVCHDDGHGMDEDQVHEDQCPKCEKRFVFTTSLSVDHYAEKADCLNGAPHRMRPVIHYPPHWPDWKRCEDCRHEERGAFASTSPEAKP